MLLPKKNHQYKIATPETSKNMDLIVKQTDLKTALDRITPAIKPSPVEILENILIRTDMGRGKLVLLGGNMEMTLELEIDAVIEEEGELTLPAQEMRELVRTLPSGPVKLRSHKGSGRIESGTVKADLPSMAADEYPAPPEITYGGVAVSARQFLKLVERATFVVNAQEARPVFRGVQLRLHSKGVEAYATDTFRLVRASFDADLETDEESILIVPPAVLDACARVFTPEDQIKVGYGGTGGLRIGFATADAKLNATLLEGKYPPVQSLFPDEVTTRHEVKKEVLEKEIMRLLVFASFQTRRINMKFLKTKINCNANSPEKGSISGEVGTKRVEGEDLYIGTNGKYLQEILGHVPGDKIEVGLTEPERPMLIKTVGGLGAGERLEYLLMPLRAPEDT